MKKRKLNLKVLKQCRLQVGLDKIEDAIKATGISNLAEIESGATELTYEQKDILEEVYSVPRWVFVLDKIPAEYNLNGEALTELRKLKPANGLMDYKLWKVMLTFNAYRIGLMEDLAEAHIRVKKINLEPDKDPVVFAAKVRKWLRYSPEKMRQQRTRFERINYWKELIEKKHTVVFTTSAAHESWSKVSPKIMKSAAIAHKKLPMIIMNGSNGLSADTFTLMHALGHILLKNTKFNSEIEPFKRGSATEKFCNEFASEMLISSDEFKGFVKQQDIRKVADNQLEELANTIGKEFCVTPWAGLVKLRYARIITQKQYDKVEQQLREKSSHAAPRDSVQQLIDFYGKTYVRNILRLYYDGDLNMIQLDRSFGSKGHMGNIRVISEMVKAA